MRVLTQCALVVGGLLWSCQITGATDPAPIAVPPSGTWDGDDGPWSSFAFRVGTPPQDVKLFIATLEGETAVVSPSGCNSTDPENCAQLRGSLYNSSQSSTWQESGLRALTEEIAQGYVANGTYGVDTAALGSKSSDGPSLDHQVVAQISSDGFYLGWFGVSNSIFNLSTPTYISSLRNQNIIPSTSYGYTAGAPYRLNGVLGSLTLGGYDSSKFTPNNITFYITNGTYKDPIVNITSIFAGNSVGGEEGGSEGAAEGILLYGNSVTATIDSNIGQMWLPVNACQAFEKAFGLEYDNQTNLYPVNDTQHALLSSQNTSVTFVLSAYPTGEGPVRITLPYAAFDLNATTPFVQKATRYFPLRRTSGSEQVKLGRAFLQEAYIIVDHDRGNFSLAQCTFDPDATQNLVAIPTFNATNAANSSSTNSSSTSSASPSSSHSGGGGGLSGGAIAGIVIGALAGAVIFATALFFCLRWRKNLDRTLKEESAPPPPPETREVPPAAPTPEPGAQQDRGIRPPIEGYYNPAAKETGVEPPKERVASPELAGDVAPIGMLEGKGKNKEQRLSELKGDKKYPTEMEGQGAERQPTAELPTSEGDERRHEME